MPLRPTPSGPTYHVRATALVLAGILAAGCGGGPSGGADAGVDASTSRDGGGGTDGSTVLPDGAVVLPDGNVVLPDGGSDQGGGGVDVGPTPDGGSGSEDSGTPLPDLAIPDGAGTVPDECYVDGGLALCGCVTAPDCASDPCPTGTLCVPDGCGGRRCVPSGHGCEDASDCRQGNSCVDTAEGRTCTRPAGPCQDSRECPLGHFCEAGDCVDRRIPCDEGAFSCPIGFACELTTGAGEAFCRVWDQPCAHSSVCPQPGACFDIDEDGDGECVPDRLECVAATCASDERVCGAQPEEKGYVCGVYGGCAAQTCADSTTCVDFAGDGRPFCSPAGTCSSHADCPAHQLCAIPHDQATPRCVGPLPSPFDP